MKKLLLTALLTLGSVANAGYMEAGVAQLEYSGETTLGYNLGIGSDVYMDNSLYMGFDFDLIFGKLNSEQVLGLGFDLNVGWEAVKGLALYGLIGVNTQSIYNSSESIFNNYYGFDYGAGVNYQISNSFAVDVKYKTSSMSYYDHADTGHNYADMDFSSIGINLKYIF